MDEPIGQIVGRRVRKLREQQGLSKRDFCLMVNISRPYLDHIEKGDSNLTIRRLAQLAEGLGVSPADLLA